MAGDSTSMLGDVLLLSDDELLEKLQEHGFSGPIVDSTRLVYQKKLIQILEGGYVPSQDCGDSEEEENDRSDPESSLRNRIHQPNVSVNSTFRPSGSSFIADDNDNEDVQPVHKPSPPRPTSFSSSSFQSSGSPYVVTSRPSLSSVSGRDTSYSSFTTSSNFLSQPKAKASTYNSSPAPSFSKVKLIIAVVVAIFLAFVFYQNLESSQDSNPIPKIGGK